MKMKKILAVSLSAVMALSMLASCSDKDDDDDEKDDDSSKTSVSSKDDDEASEDDGSSEDEASTEDTSEDDSSAAQTNTSVSFDDLGTGTVSLTEVGSFTDSDSSYDSYSDILYKTDGTSYFYCDYLGNELGDNIIYVEELDGTDYYCFYQNDGDISYCGIMDAEGNVIMPCDKAGLADAIGERFVKLYYPEEVTDNEDECIYYVTSSWVSFTPDDDDVMYKGYISIYDTVTGTVFDSVKETSDFYAYEIGDSVYYSDSEGNYHIVGADGKELTDDVSSYYEADSVYYKRNDSYDGYIVYDGGLNELFTTEYTVSGFSNDSDYLKFYDGDSLCYGIMDMSGNVILEAKYDSLDSLGNGFFEYKSGTGYGIVRADGVEITGADYDYVYEAAYYSEDAPAGYFYGSVNSSYDLIGVDGVISKGLSYPDGLIVANDDYEYLVISTGEYSIKGEYGSELNGYLVAAEDGIYEVLTGEKLLSDYDDVYTAYGYIYVKTGDEVKVYKPTVS